MLKIETIKNYITEGGSIIYDLNKMKQEGFIALYRCLLNKAIWKCSTPEQKAILITLLLMVNHKEAEWEWKGRKFDVKSGEVVTSYERIALKCGKGITIQNVRTALKRFEKLGFLTYKPTRTGTLITIVNWSLYQLESKNQHSNQHELNTDLTTNNNNNNVIKNKIPYKEIIDYLNEAVGTSYRISSKATRNLISARWNEGYRLNEFINVIDNKTKE